MIRLCNSFHSLVSFLFQFNIRQRQMSYATRCNECNQVEIVFDVIDPAESLCANCLSSLAPNTREALNYYAGDVDGRRYSDLECIERFMNKTSTKPITVGDVYVNYRLGNYIVSHKK